MKEKEKNTKTTEEAKVNTNLITVGKNKFVTGIFWQPFKDITNKQKEIKDSAKFASADLFCLKTKGVNQYGLASSKEGFKSGQVSAAVAVSTILSDKSSTVAIFKVNIGWWLLVIRNDIILPEEDRIFKTEMDAKKAFVSMLAVPDWGYKICPEDWNIADTKEVNIEELLTDKYTKATLEKVDKTAMIITAVVIILLISGSIGKVIWDKKREELLQIQRQIEEAKRLEIQRLEEKRKKELEIANMPVPPAWEKIIDPVNFTNICMKYVKSNFTKFGGWKLKSIQCDEVGIKIEWVRGEMGTNEWLLTDAKEKGYVPNNTEISISENNATGKIKYSDNELKIISSEPSFSSSELQDKLGKWFEVYNAVSKRIELKEKTVTLKENNKSESFPYVNFIFDNPRNPESVVNLLKMFSGLEFISIKCNNVNDLSFRWSYEGRIYAKK